MVNAYFMDSSALVKRYVVETGTIWIQTVASPSSHNRIIVARISWVELLSALARREREGSLALDQVTKAIQAFRYDWDTQYQVIGLDQTLVETAGQLIRRHPLRAYDAVQLASALKMLPLFASASLTSLTFLTADDRLLAVAQAEGLLTDNPTRHP
jgi:predicted nucleic acid-binding protein